jgi:phosphoribosyl 1,2-cyclic phosphodiesterase
VRVSVLGSGSGGNAILVEAGGVRLLLDAGFSATDLARRLRRRDAEPESVDAIIVTHEHGDHTRGVGVFARRYGTPVYLTAGTREACGRLFRGPERTVLYRPGYPFHIGGLRVEPFNTAHDAADPVALAVVDEESGLRVGVATDLGRPTAQIRHALTDAHLLVLEANHDEALLHAGDYPISVKSRIAGSHGHFSNAAAARFALELMHADLAAVVLAHLSSECNRPDLARAVVGRALYGAGYRGILDVARQDEPTEFFDVAELRRRLNGGQLTLF